jgi:hypothetical protein
MTSAVRAAGDIRKTFFIKGVLWFVTMRAWQRADDADRKKRRVTCMLPQGYWSREGFPLFYFAEMDFPFTRQKIIFCFPSRQHKIFQAIFSTGHVCGSVARTVRALTSSERKPWLIPVLFVVFRVSIVFPRMYSISLLN